MALGLGCCLGVRQVPHQCPLVGLCSQKEVWGIHASFPPPHNNHHHHLCPSPQLSTLSVLCSWTHSIMSTYLSPSLVLGSPEMNAALRMPSFLSLKKTKPWVSNKHIRLQELCLTRSLHPQLSSPLPASSFSAWASPVGPHMHWQGAGSKYWQCRSSQKLLCWHMVEVFQSLSLTLTPRHIQ